MRNNYVPDPEFCIDNIIGSSVFTQEIREKARHYSGFDKPVLLTGETGTGKTMLAGAMHSYSNKISYKILLDRIKSYGLEPPEY